MPVANLVGANCVPPLHRPLISATTGPQRAGPLLVYLARHHIWRSQVSHQACSTVDSRVNVPFALGLCDASGHGASCCRACGDGEALQRDGETTRYHTNTNNRAATQPPRTSGAGRAIVIFTRWDRKAVIGNGACVFLSPRTQVEKRPSRFQNVFTSARHLRGTITRTARVSDPQHLWQTGLRRCTSLSPLSQPCIYPLYTFYSVKNFAIRGTSSPPSGPCMV
ncbi:hypothetical protein BDW02DRAFT_408258 [Decorospora gaudefroyi]|uniref:Uncharacterized protein n=1 Tax=Decorospora gaudefroyi TaxID=184978 RepID=A0A6A5K8S8_9PLEO|nr:hypothetical protein BDW02DRAFT_408258 [Decorospora gaudefroyi]